MSNENKPAEVGDGQLLKLCKELVHFKKVHSTSLSFETSLHLLQKIDEIEKLINDVLPATNKDDLNQQLKNSEIF